MALTEPRFGFFFWPWSPEYTARLAGLAERDGWDLLGVADTPGNAMDVWVALTLAAARTERVGLAACVTNLATRHPAITAGAAASVDAVSGGRVLLGVGRGHSGVANLGAAASAGPAFREGLRFTRALLAGERASLNGGPATQLPPSGRRVPVFAAASGPGALRTAGAVADGAFVNYGLQADHVAHARARIGAGAAETGRTADDVETWWIACLDCAPTRDAALDTLGNILGFVAAYILGAAPAERLFDYLRRRLAIAGTPDDCVEQARAALAAGATRLMFTVSLAADPVRAVELFGAEVLPALRRGR